MLNHEYGLPEFFPWKNACYQASDPCDHPDCDSCKYYGVIDRRPNVIEYIDIQHVTIVCYNLGRSRSVTYGLATDYD